VTRSLAGFLSTHLAQAEEDYRWGGLRLHVTSYLCDDLPPAALLTSARAVVLQAGGVLVVRDPTGVHILPGGRRKPGETLAQTVRREVLEETGWVIGPPQLLGVSTSAIAAPSRPATGTRIPTSSRTSTPPTPTTSTQMPARPAATSLVPSSIPLPRCNACP
jgi:8-oxo-dGTP pyrophosphatase MutT (NUDIX family)